MTKDKIMNNILIIFYILIVGIMVVCHESWFDEAQAWLIARDLSPLEIIYQMKYEGHPFLWHYILIPFAKLGFPYVTIKVISAIFCIVAAIILIKKSSFNSFMKLLILCSTPFMYYAFVARNYCLAVLMVVLLGVFYKDRAKRPILYGTLICLLANTHVIMLGLAIMLVCTEYLYEIIFRRKEYLKDVLKGHVIGAGIASAGIMVMFVIALVGSMNNSYALQMKLDVFSLVKSFYNSYLHIVDKLTVDGIAFFGLAWVSLLGWMLYKKEWKVVLIFLGAIFFEILVCSIKYSLYSHTIQTVMLILLFCCWIFCEKNKNKDWRNLIFYLSFVIMFCMSDVESYYVVKNDMFNNFSAAKETGQFINDNIEKNAEFICVEDGSAASIIPYLNRKIKVFCIITNQYSSFITISHERREKIRYMLFSGEGDEILEKALIAKEKPTYLIYWIGLFDEKIEELKSRKILEEVYSNTTAVLSSENYKVLKIIGK